MSFNNFQIAVSDQFDRMISLSTELFYVDVSRDELFNLYLASFPEGANPIFRERTEHDCNCCKNFIRKAGNMVAIIDGNIETVWDVQLEDRHQYVANALAEAVRFRSIAGIYRQKEKTLGSKPHRETDESTGNFYIFEHFYYTLPSKFVVQDVAKFRGDTHTNMSILKRSLTEITLDATEDVIDLIERNKLIRGAEHLEVVKKFKRIKKEFDQLDKSDCDLFIWETSAEIGKAGKIKNTVIGTLLVDISTGVEIGVAIDKFGVKVDPRNYKRPTGLATKGMIANAEKKVKELEIEDSLARRFATEKDLTSNNLLFVNKTTKKKLKKSKKKSSVFDELREDTKTKISEKLQKVEIDEFIANILPHATNIEIMMENSHETNLMSLIAPTNGKCPNIMKWDNPFSWSYIGEVTDSIIKERVKRAGGSVTGLMRFSLGWRNYDDLDLHCEEPDGSHIYYGDMHSRNGGWLDVDMNAGGRKSREPVENITHETESHLKEGKYKIYVHQFAKRETDNYGFDMEMEFDGQVYLFSYDKPMKNKEIVPVIEFTYSKTNGITMGKSLPSSTTSKEVWGVTTQDWVKVNMVLNSPNHWNGQNTGNKHWFFILNDCLNPDRARGFYNEFLRNELTPHSKVFEMLSAKMKTEESDKQLSGLGFSSTLNNRLICKVGWNQVGKSDRVMEIIFANAGKEDTPISHNILEKLGLCEVCKKEVTNHVSRLPCPNGCGIFHTSHFLEWVRIKGQCPVCRRTITLLQINELVQLATV